MSLKGSDRFNHHLLHDNSTYAICQMRSMIYAMSKHAFTFQQQPAGCLKHGLHGMPRCLVTQVRAFSPSKAYQRISSNVSAASTAAQSSAAPSRDISRASSKESAKPGGAKFAPWLT